MHCQGLTMSFVFSPSSSPRVCVRAPTSLRPPLVTSSSPPHVPSHFAALTRSVAPLALITFTAAAQEIKGDPKSFARHDIAPTGHAGRRRWTTKSEHWIFWSNRATRARMVRKRVSFATGE